MQGSSDLRIQQLFYPYHHPYLNPTIIPTIIPSIISSKKYFNRTLYVTADTLTPLTLNKVGMR